MSVDVSGRELRGGFRLSLLVRHRFLGDPGRELWRCTRGASSLYASPDPLCPGCGLEIRWADVPRVERYLGVSGSRLLAEDLGIRLDLRVLELALAEQREALRV